MSKPSVEFKSIKECSAIEWPGKIVAIVYTPGCNLRCPYCYNPDLIENSGDSPTLTQEDVLVFLKSREDMLDGLMVTGGEPTIHSELTEFAKEVKKRKVEFGLETNGTNPRMLKDLIERKLVDYIAMDVKAPLNEEVKYRTVTRCDELSIEDICESIRLIRRSGIDYEFRTTLVPTLLTLEEVCTIARQIGGAKRYYIRQFKSENTLDPIFQRIFPYSPKELEYAWNRVKDRFDECGIRGVAPERLSKKASATKSKTSQVVER